MKAGILLVCLLTISLFSNAQNPLEDPYNNRPLVKNITTPVLKDLEVNQPVEFEKLKYRYINSFDVERIHCDNCKVDYFEFFNLYLFDIEDFEDQREKTVDVSFIYKEKYEVTLYSKKKVSTAYASIIADHDNQMVNMLPTQLPTYNNTGSPTSDYQAYSAALLQYQTDYPEDYSKHISLNGFLTISYQEFYAMPENRQESVLNNPQGYVILQNHPVGAIETE